VIKQCTKRKSRREIFQKGKAKGTTYYIFVKVKGGKKRKKGDTHEEMEKALKEPSVSTLPSLYEHDHTVIKKLFFLCGGKERTT
jgi:hypothetical protein